MILLLPAITVLVTIVKKLRTKVLKYSDLRVRMMNEILSGIRILKFYGWERPFRKQVGKLREKELDTLTRLAYISGVGFALLVISAPIIQPILVFSAYVKIQDDPLTPSTAFTTVALFNIMRFPFVFMPLALVQYVQSVIALKRVVRYLRLPELTPYVETTPHPDITQAEDPMAQPGSISITKGYFSWIAHHDVIEPFDDPPQQGQDKKKTMPVEINKSDHQLEPILLETSIPQAARSTSNNNEDTLDESTMLIGDGSSRGAAAAATLRDITCHIPAGSLVAVVGPVGCGKSSFLSAILGEMEAIHGSKIYLPHDQDDKDDQQFIAYCSQTPWVVNDTLRGNILFGREFDEARYHKVLEACALMDDLAALPSGDQTEIGERGINLSGGQKARVSLARAVYSAETRVLLFDDPLSAVDSGVSEHLFTNAIAGDVTRGATRIIVTHHVHVLPECDSVIVLEDGQIKHQGTHAELIASRVDFAGAITQAARSEPKEEKSNKEDVDVEVLDLKVKNGPTAPKTEGERVQGAGAKLMDDEERKEGSVEGSAYLHYARAGGTLITIGILCVQVVGRGLEVVGTFWLAYWSTQASESYLSDSQTVMYLCIYSSFGVLSIIAVAVRGVLLAKHRLGASTKLHDDLTESILRAPVSFFDVTPLGRILNRFSADCDKVDLGKLCILVDS
jgi:ATP-binding cassette subfamily C (CFTR/MRP) protein 1